MSDPKVITLSDGRTAVVREGKGRDVRAAQRMMGDDVSFYMNCLMSLLVTIDGKQLVPEEFDDLPAPDYMTLMGDLSDANFTSPQKK